MDACCVRVDAGMDAVHFSTTAGRIEVIGGVLESPWCPWSISKIKSRHSWDCPRISGFDFGHSVDVGQYGTSTVQCPMTQQCWCFLCFFFDSSLDVRWNQKPSSRIDWDYSEERITTRQWSLVPVFFFLWYSWSFSLSMFVSPPRMKSGRRGKYAK